MAEYLTIHILLRDAGLAVLGSGAHAVLLIGFGVAGIFGAWVARN